MIRYWMIAIALIATSNLLPLSSLQAEEAPRQLTVLAEEELSLVLPIIARHYTQEHHVTVTLSFDSTAQQVARIEEKEAADILISSSVSAMKRLKSQNLLDSHSHPPIASNRLILAAAAASPLELTLNEGDSLTALLPASPPLLFAIPNPDLYAEGEVAKQALTALGIATNDETMLPPALDALPHTGSIVVLPQKQDVLELIACGQGYGVIYATEARRFPTSIHQAALLPESLHMAAAYQAVAVASETPEAARNFIAYLRSEAARRIFENGGFIAPAAIP